MVTSSANELLDVFIGDNARGGDKEIDSVKSKNIDEAAQNLIRDSAGWKALKNTPGGETVEVTYKFLQGDGKWSIPLNEEAREVYKMQLGRIADVANIKFTEYTGSEKANLNVQVTPDRGNVGGSSYPLKDGAGTDFKYQEKMEGQSYGHNIYIHEISHSLGLAHPGNYNFGGEEASLTYVEDNLDYSVMSYNDGLSGVRSFGLQIDDISALQRLYGANDTTRIENTVYGFNSTASDAQFNISSGLQKLKDTFAIWDGGGNDTLDLSGFAQDQRIDLHDGTLSDVGGLKHGVGIAKNAIIENAIGGSGNDVLIGNSANNNLSGNGGDDIIYGAEGADSLFGGAGKDSFIYRNKADSLLSSLGQKADGSAVNHLVDVDLTKLVGSIDTIFDFQTGNDKIDLSFFAKGDAPAFRLTQDLPTQNGQLALKYFSDDNMTLLTAHIDSTQGAPDFVVKIIGQVDFVQDIIV